MKSLICKLAALAMASISFFVIADTQSVTQTFNPNESYRYMVNPKSYFNCQVVSDSDYKVFFEDLDIVDKNGHISGEGTFTVDMTPPVESSGGSGWLQSGDGYSGTLKANITNQDGTDLGLKARVKFINRSKQKVTIRCTGDGAAHWANINGYQVIHPGEIYRSSIDSVTQYTCAANTKPFFLSYSSDAEDATGGHSGDGNFKVTYTPSANGELKSSNNNSTNNSVHGDISIYRGNQSGLTVNTKFTNQLTASDVMVKCTTNNALPGFDVVTWKKIGIDPFFQKLQQIPAGESIKFVALGYNSSDFHIQCKHLYNIPDESFDLSYENQVIQASPDDFTPSASPAWEGSISNLSSKKDEIISLNMHLKKSGQTFFHAIAIKLTNNAANAVSVGCESNAETYFWLEG